MAIVGVQRGELGRRDSAGEHVVVVAGDRDHREDLTVLRVHRDADGLREAILLDPLAQLGVNQLLQAVVDGQHDGVPDDRLPQRKRLYLALRGVALDLAPAVRSAKVALVDALDAGPTDVVVAEIALVAQLSELVLGDRTGVSDDRRIECPVDVEPDAFGIDAHTRKELGPLGDGERDLPRNRRLRDAHRLVGVALPLRPDGISHRVAGQAENGAEALKELGLPQPRQVDGDHAYREARNVAGEDITAPVGDAAALGRYGQPKDAVLLRKVVVVVATHDLEVIQACGERREDHRDHNAEGDEAPGVDEGARLLSHHTPNAPCLSVARRRSLATG